MPTEGNSKPSNLERDGHAVVIGGSMAGLLAARVLANRFERGASEVIDVPWRLAAGADFAHPGVTGHRARTTGAINWYVGQVQRAATRDEAVCRALVPVTGLLAPPSALFRPRIALRVFRHSLVRRRKPAATSVPEVPAAEAA